MLDKNTMEEGRESLQISTNSKHLKVHHRNNRNIAFKFYDREKKKQVLNNLYTKRKLSKKARKKKAEYIEFRGTESLPCFQGESKSAQF